MRRLFLGVDGGQSSTAVLIGDESGRVLGEGTGGPCNHTASGEGGERLRRAITESVSLACAQAGLARTVRFAVACCGMSGGPDDKRAILEELLRADRLIVATDAEISLAGATTTGRGILVIAGTGSIAFGRNDAGATARAGGWGFIFGDEGSAFDIVRQALRAALREEEGWGPRTALRQSLLEATGAGNANEALHLFYTLEWPRDRVAALAPLVDAAAVSGDETASEVLYYAALQMATLVASVQRRLWSKGEAVEVAFSGGVFQSDTVRDRFRELVELEPETRCGPARHKPVEGALLEAWRAASVAIAEDWGQWGEAPDGHV
jgi:N-acetylglucosamine kinase-like BadF-type ATPase